VPRHVDAPMLVRLPMLGRLAVMVVGIVVLWVAVIVAESHTPVDLTVVLLVALAFVLVVAVGTGPVLGIVFGLVAVVLVNWYLVPPYHTFAVSNPDNVVALVVFALVAGIGSVLAELNARVRVGAARSRERATLLADVVAKTEHDDPAASLERVRAALELDRLSLVRGEVGASQVLATAGSGPDVRSAEATVVVTVPGGYRLLGAGPQRMAEDPEFIESLAAAAVRSYESDRMESEAQRAEQLAAVDEARTALLASVGHDLRTPLSGLRVAVDALRDSGSALDEQTRAELLETVDDSTTRLDELITNLLDMSRLEAGVLAVRRGPTSVDAAVAAALLNVGRAHVVADLPDSLALADADPVLLERVVENLVSNAVRYAAPTDAQPVQVSAYARDDAVVIDVVDHGPGLREHAPREGRVSAGGGADRSTGLGLEIVRGFCAAMGARVDLLETAGGGLTARVTLPREDGS
jgi:K+-sensing histidine kinase KdpD